MEHENATCLAQAGVHQDHELDISVVYAQRQPPIDGTHERKEQTSGTVEKGEDTV